jgi:ribosomal protein S19
MLRKFYLDRVLQNRIFKNKIFDKEESANEILLKSKRIEAYDKKIKNVFLNKRSFLCKSLVGRRIFVHNGREIVSLKILPSMLGFKVGEFFFNKKVRNIK